jgi:hypothetical protein
MLVPAAGSHQVGGELGAEREGRARPRAAGMEKYHFFLSSQMKVETALKPCCFHLQLAAQKQVSSRSKPNMETAWIRVSVWSTRRLLRARPRIRLIRVWQCPGPHVGCPEYSPPKYNDVFSEAVSRSVHQSTTLQQHFGIHGSICRLDCTGNMVPFTVIQSVKPETNGVLSYAICWCFQE